MDSVGSILIALASGFAIAEFYVWTPFLSTLTLKLAIRRLDPHVRARYEEEWHALFEDMPNGLLKLMHGLSLLMASSEINRIYLLNDVDEVRNKLHALALEIDLCRHKISKQKTAHINKPDLTNKIRDLAAVGTKAIQSSVAIKSYNAVNNPPFENLFLSYCDKLGNVVGESRALIERRLQVAGDCLRNGEFRVLALSKKMCNARTMFALNLMSKNKLLSLLDDVKCELMKDDFCSTSLWGAESELGKSITSLSESLQNAAKARNITVSNDILSQIDLTVTVAKSDVPE